DLTVSGGSVASDGGGIAVDATGSLTMSTSTVSGNTATDDGGGIYLTGAGGAVALTNVTLSGNAANVGGGLYCQGPCTLTNVTITDNTASSSGGGVRQRTGGGSVTFLNTIVANNSAPVNVDCQGGNLISNGYNLSSDATCDFTNTGDLENTDPLVGPLQDNGGPTFTHELLVGSLAIDTGTNTGCPATDQRGVARPVNVTCDKGAYEAAAVAPDITVMKTVTTLEDPFNGTTDPKAIPAATVLYTIGLTNSGSGPADVDSVVITEPIPANTALRVIDFDAGNAGPVAFVDGTPASGLTYTFVALGDPGDDVEFSNDGGSTYTYTPVADGNGVDTTVTDIRINPKGTFLSSTSGDPNFEVLFKAIVQ
ncbi:MAG: choice-of-anchor Q domain-containing protein, partial [Pseudomonadales bacterium]